MLFPFTGRIISTVAHFAIVWSCIVPSAIYSQDGEAVGGGVAYAPGASLASAASVQFDYIFTEEKSDVEVRIPETPAEEVEEFVENLDAKIFETDVIRTQESSMASQAVDDISDFVDDRNGESGIASDQPVWQGTFADTLVETRDPYEAGAHSSGVTTFENGYIPKYEEELKLADDVPFVGEYAYSNQGGRLPDDWVVPPSGGGTAHSASSDSAYATYADSYQYRPYGVGGYGPPPAPYYRGSGSSYPGGYYDPRGYAGSHHPEGPYGYRFGVEDPFWDGGRTYYGDAGYEVDAGWPLFSRFDPELAHLKAGPFYLQFISVEVGVLYSDYDGPAVFPRGEEDGWLGFTSLRMRAAARITSDLYFTLSGEIIYVFGAGGLGLRSDVGQPFASLNYRTQWGMWDVRIYDELGTYLPFYFANEDDAFKRAGRYSFGFLGYDRSRDAYLYDPVIYNRVGIQATRLVSPDWRLSVEADHTDFFYLDSDRGDDHQSREHFGISLAAEEGAVPFNPYLRYDAYSNDFFDSWINVLYLGGSTMLSHNVFFDARTGYLWNSGDNANGDGHWLWDVGLRHQINRRTFHGFRVGQDFFVSDFTDDSVVSSFAQYYIHHEISERTRIYGFAQWSRDEFLSGRLVGGEFESDIYGVRLYHRLSERVSSHVGYRFEERRNTATGEETERKIFDANLDFQVARQVTGYLRYQFEDDEVFDEDLYMAGLRRYF